MSDQFLGEIKIVSFNFPPKGWAFCNGQLLAISQNQALFSLLGTTFGGNGVNTFALPNLQGGTPLHVGNGFSLGAVGGEASHTLVLQEMPAHTHTLQAAAGTAASTADPTGAILGNAAIPMYGAFPSGANGVNVVQMDPGAAGSAGGSQPHNNLQPYLVLNFVIALQGIFPSRN